MDSALMETIAIAGGLAGIGCREDFGIALERHWKFHERSGSPLSLLLVEIDFFQQYQAACDIAASDDCLDAVAAAIVENARQPGAVAFAWGAGLFAVILPETGALEAEWVASEICFQAEALVIPHPRSPIGRTVTISVGLATARPSTGVSPMSLARDAELALLRTRERCRGQRRESGRVAAATA